MNLKINYGRFFFGNVGVPSGLKRLAQIPNSSESKISFISLENIIQNNAKIYISFDERDIDTTLLDQIVKGLEESQYGNVLKLEVDDDIDNHFLILLKNNSEIMDEDIFIMQVKLL